MWEFLQAWGSQFLDPHEAEEHNDEHLPRKVANGWCASKTTHLPELVHVWWGQVCPSHVKNHYALTPLPPPKHCATTCSHWVCMQQTWFHPVWDRKYQKYFYPVQILRSCRFISIPTYKMHPVGTIFESTKKFFTMSRSFVLATIPSLIHCCRLLFSPPPPLPYLIPRRHPFGL